MTTCLATLIVSTNKPAREAPAVLAAFESEVASTNAEIIIAKSSDPGGHRCLADSTGLEVTVAESESGLKAIKAAIKQARGEFLIFTAENMRPLPGWMSSFVRGPARHPDANLFCGPIKALIPPHTPGWLLHNRFSALACEEFVAPMREGPLPDALPDSSSALPYLHFGSNMLIRASALDHHGLSKVVESCAIAIPGFELAHFEARIRQALKVPIYIPSARLVHELDVEAKTFDAQFETVFSLGRTFVAVNGFAHLKPASWLDCWLLAPSIQFFEFGMLLNFYYGELYEVCNARDPCWAGILLDSICALGWSGDASFLSPSAKEWLRCTLEYVPRSAKPRFAQTGLPDLGARELRPASGLEKNGVSYLPESLTSASHRR